ncbi:HotDog domain-containing protein [Multifurca ochricompacta]|uniref:HotDog domain-containing protein n=1 Tax=Multifurca ochricompacta TaxID=376703 RepID=A0AAD4MAM6_9AGAM|nr:HotDog domain-containing protein [Multifurca ochricompacta]
MTLPANKDAASLADSRIKGNLSPQLKFLLEEGLYRVMSTPTLFGASIGKRIVITEASIVPKAEEASKTEARVVCELIVREDMLNPGGSLHGGCAAFLVDICSTLVLLASGRSPGVSASMDVVYHAPAAPGAKLRIVNTAMAVGARIMSARTEIWDDTTKRLCVTGIHVKMEPSAPKDKAKM